jgi:hypothetical protein
MEKELGAVTGEESGVVVGQIDDVLAKIKADTTRMKGDAKDIPEAAFVLQCRKVVRSKGKGDEVVEVPARVTKLEERMFEGCTALRTVELHDGVTEIGERAFGNCSNLTELKAAPGTKIDDNAFWGCTALEAKAKAEGFFSVNKFVVERSMPESWAMQKGAEAGNLELPASVAREAAAGADKGKGGGDVRVDADPAAPLEPVSGTPGDGEEDDVDAAGNKDKAACCNCGGSGRTKYPWIFDKCLGDEAMIKEENVLTNTLHVEQGVPYLLGCALGMGIAWGLLYFVCVLIAGGSIAWPHGLSLLYFLVLLNRNCGYCEKGKREKPS